MAFQIHSVLHLSMPAGQIDQIVSQVNAKLRTINGAINLNINPSAIKNIQSLNTQLLSLDKTLQSIAINSTTAATSLSRLGSSLSATQAKTSAISSSMSTVTNSIGAVKVASGEGAVALEHFSSQAGLALRRFLAFGVAAGSVLAVFSGIKAGISSAIEFQRQMVRLQQVGETSRSALAGISTEITRLAVNFGASSKDLAEAAVVIRQAGYSANETKVALEALAQAALSPNFDNMKQNTEGAIAILSQFKLSMDQLLPSFGSVNAVAAAFAVEAKDIIQAVQRAGGVFSGLGGNLHEFIALFSSVRATTRESAETISTGLRTIFARLQRSDTVEALREFRVELRRTAAEAQQLGDLGLTDQFVGPYEAIRRISEAIRNIPDTDPRIAQLFEQIGGYRQLSRLLPLLRESDTQDRALNISRGGEISLLASTEKAQESLINKTHQTGEAFASLFRKIADDKGFQTFISAGLRITGMLADWLKILTPLVPLLLTVGTIKLFQAISPLGRPAQSFTQTFVGNSNPPFIPIPGGPRRYASGGIVPGHGFTDNQPAVLESGSFVIRRDSAQKIGYDNLSRMGFNKGGSVPVILTPGEFVFDEKQAARIGSPQLHHMNNTGKIPGMAGGGNANAELLASIGISPTKPSRETSEKLKSYTSSGGIHPAWVKALTKSDESYFARKSIAKASEINEINDMIPAGSKFIANGAFAFAVRTPDGQVLRIQATDRPVQRSDFPEALQANESKYISGVNVEKLDYVPDIYSMVESGQMSSGRASRVIEAMKKRLLNKRDYKARDLHEGNIGYTRETGFKIIDPDFASGGVVKLNSGGRVPKKGFADGGLIPRLAFGGGDLVSGPSDTNNFKLNQEAIKKAFDELQKAAGVDLSSAVKKITIDAIDYSNPKNLSSANTAGKFSPKLKQIDLNSKQINSEFRLIHILGHELGHAIDLALGGGKGYHSEKIGTTANLLSNEYKNKGLIGKPKGHYYNKDITESFAEISRYVLAGGTDKLDYRNNLQGNVDFESIKSQFKTGILSKFPPLNQQTISSEVQTGSSGIIPFLPNYKYPLPSESPNNIGFRPPIHPEFDIYPLKEDLPTETIINGRNSKGQFVAGRPGSVRGAGGRFINNPPRPPIDTYTLTPDEPYGPNPLPGLQIPYIGNTPNLDAQAIVAGIPKKKDIFGFADEPNKNQTFSRVLTNDVYGLAPPIQGVEDAKFFKQQADIYRHKKRFFLPESYLNSQGFESGPFSTIAPGFIDPFNQGPERLRAPLKGQFSTSQLNKEIGPENLKSDIRSFYQKQVDLEQSKLPANQRLLETTPEVESRVANFQIKQQYGRILQNLINSADNQIARKDFAKKDVELQSQILKERANNLEQLKQINKDTNITYRKKGFFSSETEISSVGGSGSGEGFLGRLLGRGMSSEAYAARIQSLAYGGVLAAPIISQYLSSGVGQATEESGTGFKGIRSFAGGLQGAAVGGFAAQALGARTPLTLGLGILAGAVLGAAQALQEAEREIRAAKIEKQMATFGSTLQVITNQLQRTGTVSGSDARENINSLRQTMSLVEESAADRASSLYGWIPGTEQSVNSARDRELRQTFSSQAGGIFNFLSQSAQQFGRENSQIPNLPRSQNQLRNDFFAGNDGLNARYISLLSRLNNRSIESTLNQFNEDIIRGQARGQRLTAEGSENRTFSAFGKLASILEETVRNFNRFNTVLRGISGIVSGRSELGTIEPPTDLFSRLGTPGFAQNIISGLEVAGGRGEGLQESLLNLNRVAEILPDVLASARNSPNAQSAGINVRQGLISSLGFTQENLPTSLAQIIGTVQSRISDQSFEDLKKNFEDTQKTAREILQPFQAIVETAQRLGQSQTTYLNSLFQGLNQYNNLLLQSGETLNRSVVQRFEAIRTRAGFEADRTGLAQFSLISREQATRPFSSRQEFLTQGTGVANIYDPREIANNINITREEIARRTTDLVNNPGNLRNGTNNGEALRVLNDRVVRLNQALENLTNSSNRTAYAQARLSELTQERNARFNASASYIASGADGQLETRRYLAIANRALESGRGFSGIASDDAAGTIRTLQGLGGVRNENGRSFENILQELIARTNGLPFNPDQNIGQIRSFQAEITAAQIAQADATAQLAIVQTSATERFFQELSANQARFLAELQVRFIEADIARVRAIIDNRSGDLRPLTALQTSVNTIRNLTGTTDENSADLLSSLNNVSIRNRLTTLQNRYRPLADLRTTLEQPGRVDQILQQVDIGEILTRTRARIRAGGQGWNRMILQNEAGNELLAGSNNNGINSVLSSLGITSPEATEQFRIRFRTGASNQFRTGTETQDSIRALVSSTLGEVLNIQTSRFLAQDVNRNDLRDVNAAPGLQGVNIQDLLLTGQLDALLTASQRLRQENITSFQTLSERLGVVTTSLRGFNAELATLQATLAIANIPHGQDFDDYLTGQGYFSGGPVYAQRGKLINFEPRGTDTVPAMLTPGEFVVNATSTRKYLDLLRNINENRSPLEGLDQYFKGGTVYAAAGAFINPGLSAIDFRDAVNPDYRPQLRELSRARFQTEREAVRNFGGASALLDYVRRSGEANNNSGDIVGGINRFLAAQSRNILLSQINAQGGQRDREQGQFISQAFSDRVQGNLNSFRNLSSLRQSAFTNREQINQAEERENRFINRGPRFLTPRVDIRPFRNFDFFDRNRRFHTGGEVPAYLTAGEYVLRPEAVSNIGIGTLNRMNYASGGQVGNAISSAVNESSLGSAPRLREAVSVRQDDGLVNALQRFNGDNQPLITAFNNFSNASGKLAESLSKFPSSVTIEGRQTVEVIINGTEAWANIKPEVQEMIVKQTKTELNNFIKNKFPDINTD